MAKGNVFFGKETVVASYPAFDVVRRETHNVHLYDEHVYVELTELVYGDQLALKTDRTTRSGASMNHCYHYRPGSVVSYALEYNEDPIKAIERAKKNGHGLYFITQNATVISNMRQERKTYIEVEYGMVVRFEGLVATIEKDHNDNLKFVPVDLTKFKQPQ